jgi:hypothetical protein
VRSRYEDPTTGEWVSETEVVETASELVELYNPAEVYAAFAEAAREAAGLDPQPTAADELLETAGIPPEETSAWTTRRLRRRGDGGPPAGGAGGGRRGVRPPGVTWHSTSRTGASKRGQPHRPVRGAPPRGHRSAGRPDHRGRRRRATVLGINAASAPRSCGGRNGEWRQLSAPDDIVEFYDPTDVFGTWPTLAEAFRRRPLLEDEDDSETR